MGADGEATREQIMEATYEALIETGYADLTMSDIANASGTSTSLLHYHFDTKEDLLVAFLDHLVENIERDLDEEAPDDPIGRLHYILQWYVVSPEEKEREAFHVALLELRVQAPRNDRYRSRIREADRVIREALTRAIEDGIDEGLIAGESPETVAAVILAAADGAETRWLMTGEAIYSDFVTGGITDYLLTDLFTVDARKRWDELTEDG